MTTKQRMMGELEELEAATAQAPEDHPARIALSKVRAYLEAGPSAKWYEDMADHSVRRIATWEAAGRGVLLPERLASSEHTYNMERA